MKPTDRPWFGLDYGAAAARLPVMKNISLSLPLTFIRRLLLAHQWQSSHQAEILTPLKHWYMEKLIEWVYSDMYESETPSCL